MRALLLSVSLVKAEGNEDSHDDGMVDSNPLVAKFMSFMDVIALQESGSVPIRLLVCRLSLVRDERTDQTLGNPPMKPLLFTARVTKVGSSWMFNGRVVVKLR
jgi:hypothetical protein